MQAAAAPGREGVPISVLESVVKSPVCKHGDSSAMKQLLRVAAVCSLVVIVPGCDRHRYVTKPMTWECAESEYKPSFKAKPDEYARFRFVENAHCFEVESSKNFCAELHQSGKAIVDVKFEVWKHGHRMVAVDGRSVQDVGGWGSNGANDYTGACPPNN